MIMLMKPFHALSNFFVTLPLIYLKLTLSIHPRLEQIIQFSVFCSLPLRIPLMTMFYRPPLLNFHGILLALFLQPTFKLKSFNFVFQLTNLSHGDKIITEYFGKVRALTDNLATTSNFLPEKELVTYLFTGLGPLYEGFVNFITTRIDPISSLELYQMLLIHENRLAHSLKQLVKPFANFTSHNFGGRIQRGRESFHGRQGRGRGNYPNCGGRDYSPNSSGTYTQTPSSPRPTCQICQKIRHVAFQCHHRFNHSYQPDPPPYFSTHILPIPYLLTYHIIHLTNHHIPQPTNHHIIHPLI